MRASSLGIRWTIGDVSLEGFEALRLSIWGAHGAFGADAAYAVCVNNVPLDVAKERVGELPVECAWHEVTREVPAFMRPHLDGGMAQGAGWKLAPLRLFHDRHELSLDNDCILWAMPEPIRRWLESRDGACLLAEDVRACFGRFANECGPAPRNAGIRGLPPGLDLERAMTDVLRAHGDGRPLVSELDEQGLQVAALTRSRRTEVVPLADVTICSPFPPHHTELGRCGAHFCGLNAHDLGWELDGRPASSFVRDHWRRHRWELYTLVGLEPPSDAELDARDPRDTHPDLSSADNIEA